MIQQLAGGAAELNLGEWPVVRMSLLDAERLAADSERAVEEMVGALAEVILSADARGMRFELNVDFFAAVSDIFEQCAPFILQFALALARPDIFAASQRCMEGTVVRFHDPDDAPLVDMVAQLIQHVPQGAPIRFEAGNGEK
jgi:hypothetical protein